MKISFLSRSFHHISFDIENAFKENKRLRVLNLSGSIVARELTSSSIGGLKHLRYFATKGADFGKGIGRLSFLQTLSYFTVGDKEKKWNAACGIEELEGLNLLTGDLTIDGLEKVTSVTEACRANLKKKNLRRLNLTWWNGRNAKNHEAVLEGLQPHPNLRTLEIWGFEDSKLPRWIEDSSCLPSLRSLTLRSMKSLKCIGNELYYFAAGGSSPSSATITTIAFPSLKKLFLENMHSLEEWVVPVSPQKSTTGATNNYCFPLLEEINIHRCYHLSTITPTTIIFPSLKVLDLSNIDESAVKKLVTNNLNSLTILTLRHIPNLITLPRQGLMENNNTLLSLEIVWCDKFEGFFPPNNEEGGHDDDDDDEGGDCPYFEGFLPPNKDEDDNDQGGEVGEGGGQQLQQISQVVSSSTSSSSSSLQSLTLYGCPALWFYPNFLHSLTSLRTLEIQECKESQSLLTCLSSSSSSSSSSSLEHLEHVKILKNKTATSLKEEVVFEWRKSSLF